jgi:HD superfamily phosphodiesterase
MDRITQIINHPQYIDYLNRNAQAEQDRIFCRHDFRHFLDVARVAYILALEDKLPLAKEMIYATALLHDIGRWKEYSQGVDHALASANLASGILADCGFTPEETGPILDAIAEHRNKGNQSSALSSILYRSDKLSRPCHECLVRSQCKRLLAGEEPRLEY